MVEGVKVGPTFGWDSTGPHGLHFGGAGLRNLSALTTVGGLSLSRKPLGALLGRLDRKKAFGFTL